MLKKMNHKEYDELQKTITGGEKMNKKELENLIVLYELEIVYWEAKIRFFTNDYNKKTWKKELNILKLKLLDLKMEYNGK